MQAFNRILSFPFADGVHGYEGSERGRSSQPTTPRAGDAEEGRSPQAARMPAFVALDGQLARHGASLQLFARALLPQELHRHLRLGWYSFPPFFMTLE